MIPRPDTPTSRALLVHIPLPTKLWTSTSYHPLAIPSSRPFSHEANNNPPHGPSKRHLTTLASKRTYSLNICPTIICQTRSQDDCIYIFGNRIYGAQHLQARPQHRIGQDWIPRTTQRGAEYKHSTKEGGISFQVELWIDWMDGWIKIVFTVNNRISTSRTPLKKNNQNAIHSQTPSFLLLLFSSFPFLLSFFAHQP